MHTVCVVSKPYGKLTYEETKYIEKLKRVNTTSVEYDSRNYGIKRAISEDNYWKPWGSYVSKHTQTKEIIAKSSPHQSYRPTAFLTHWGRVTHICVSKLTIIGSDNGLSPGRRQAIIWTNARILLIRTLGTNFSEILSKIPAFSFKKMHLKMSSAKWRQFCVGLNVLILHTQI